VSECFFWYRLTRVVPDKFHRAVKQLCVCNVMSSLFVESQILPLSHLSPISSHAIHMALDLVSTLKQSLVQGLEWG